jgi:nicotinamide riboside transporter PnuC
VTVLITALKWIASISGIVAAIIVAFDSGRRVTGWGFVIFVGSSIAWIAGALLTKDGALGTQNAVLLAVNLFGVYRYLVREGQS